MVSTNFGNFSNREIRNCHYYIRMAEEFVEKYYAQNIHVQDIADYVGICRSHLTTLFQDNLQMSPSEYITHFRLTRAHELILLSRMKFV